MNDRRIRILSIATIAAVLSANAPLISPTAQAADPKAAPTFTGDVQGILNNSCVNCHNPSKKKGGVDLESLAAVMKSVKPGSPEQSRLYRSLIGAKGTKAMPPKKRLAPNEIDTVKAWIAGGAKEK